MSSEHERLAAAASAALPHAYAPFSHFDAAAAVATDSGGIVPGVIVENISLGLAMCAERAAMFTAVSRGERPTALLLLAPRTDGELTRPCGACLQVALELGGPEVTVIAQSIDDQASASHRLGDLLPFGPHKG